MSKASRYWQFVDGLAAVGRIWVPVPTPDLPIAEAVAAASGGPAPGHPERWNPDARMPRKQRALWRQLAADQEDTPRLSRA
ncbi:MULTISPECIES: DUF6059 family protein [unclassified Streptomyces]|uniref:DUF6059 family protein n=1 Tax=unclassified Streptomyces TaxID=2593676 RepID=UPI002E298EC4|nr:DUF6059 family protein [Streptomyces sp. NBC_00223]